MTIEECVKCRFNRHYENGSVYCGHNRNIENMTAVFNPKDKLYVVLSCPIDASEPGHRAFIA